MSFYVSARPVLSAANVLDQILAFLSARPAASLLGGTFVHLYKAATVPPNPGSIPGDFTEPVFPGYAPFASSFPGPPITLDGNLGRGVLCNTSFICTAPNSPPENILGYFLTNAGPVDVYWAEAFAAPIPITFGGDFIDLTLIFPLAFATLTGQ